MVEDTSSQNQTVQSTPLSPLGEKKHLMLMFLGLFGATNVLLEG